MKRWLPALGALAGIAIGMVIGWALAGDDVGKIGGRGALRFILMLGAIGGFAGYLITARVTRGPLVTREGFTLSYRPQDPIAAGYRELRTLSVGDLLERLRAVGYTPAIEACDEVGDRRGAADPAEPLVGANVALTDRGVRGWLRLQLPPPSATQTRALGILEVWSGRGESADELALFTLRALSELVSGLSATREASQLSEDPVGVLTAGLAERPRHRS